MKHVILPPLRKYGPAELREGIAASAIVWNGALQAAGKAIERAGGTYSHEIESYSIYLDDSFRVDTRRCDRPVSNVHIQAKESSNDKPPRAAVKQVRTQK